MLSKHDEGVKVWENQGSYSLSKWYWREGRVGWGVEKCLVAFLLALVVALLSPLFLLLHHTWTHENAQFHLCGRKITHTRVKGGGERLVGKRNQKYFRRRWDLMLGNECVQTLPLSEDYSNKNKFKNPQSYLTHDYWYFPPERPLTLIWTSGIAPAICMGVCRVRDGGGEKRGKKRIERRGRVNEKQERKIYVRWRKRSETRRKGCGRSGVRGLVRGRRRGREEKKVPN